MRTTRTIYPLPVAVVLMLMLAIAVAAWSLMSAATPASAQPKDSSETAVEPLPEPAPPTPTVPADPNPTNTRANVMALVSSMQNFGILRVPLSPATRWPGKTIAGYKIERRYHYGDNNETSNFHLVESLLHAGEVASSHSFVDRDLYVNQTFSYRVTAFELANNELTALPTQVTPSYTAREQDILFGYGVATGAMIMIEPPTLIDAADMRVKVFRSGHGSGGIFARRMLIGNLYPASDHIETDGYIHFSDTGVPPGIYRGYSVEFWEQVEGEDPTNMDIFPLQNPVVLSSVHPPGAPTALQTSRANDGNVLLEWTLPALHHQAGLYEVVRQQRSVFPGPNTTEQVIGTTRGTSFVDRTSHPSNVHSYSVRSVAIGASPIRTEVSMPVSSPPMQCYTNYDGTLDVSEIDLRYNTDINNPWLTTFITDGSFYGLSPDGFLERCSEINTDSMYMERKLTFKHVLDDSCGGAWSCTVEVSDSDTVRVETLREIKGFARFNWTRFTDTTPFAEPGAYKFSYRLCTLADSEVCSAWEPMGNIYLNEVTKYPFQAPKQ